MALYKGIEFVTGVLLSATISIVASEDCVYSKPCTCATSSFKIDLQPLMSKITYLPAKDSSGQFNYFIDPCNKVIDKCQTQGKLSGSTACQQDVTASLWYPLGNEANSNAHGDPEKDEVVFTNQANDGTTNRVLNVKVKCADVDGSVSTVDSQSGVSVTYTMTLSTRFACKNPYAESGGGLSAGSVLVILFFVFLVVYLVGGVLFLKFVRKAEGTEAIPNYEFWKDLPSLIKDGVLFTFRGCKTESTYEKI